MAAQAEVDLFVYEKPYPIAPHFVSWAVFSILGVVLFIRALRAPSAPRRQ